MKRRVANIIPTLITALMLGTTLVSGAVLTANKVSADDTDVVDNVEITVPVSCSMTGTGMDSHTDEVPNGTYQADIGTTTIHAFCNDANGFALYSVGFTDDEYGKNVLSNATLDSTYDIVTGTATSAGTEDVSNWAMKLAITQDSGETTGTNAFTLDSDTEGSFGSYHTVPAEYTKVAHKESATDMTANTGGVKLTTTYAAYISKNQSAGTYTGQVKYTLVHPADATPPAPITSSCSTPVPNLTYMQDLNSTNKASILAGMTEDAQYFLKDKRDEKSYCVAKLKDGNIWMTQNLDHDIVTTPNYYTNENTDIGWNSNTGSYDTASWTPERATYATGATTWDAYNRISDPNGVDGYYHPESYEPGDLYVGTDAINGWKYYYSCDASSCDATIYPELNSEWKAYFDSCDTGTVNNCDNSLRPSNNTSLDGIDQYHLGNYYNWTAAIAMNDSSSITADNTDVNQSICPANWTLDKADITNGSFYYLINQYGTWNGVTGHMDNGYNPIDSPIYLSPSGVWHGSLENVGNYGDFWSSVLWDSYGAYSYSANVDGYVDPGIGDGGRRGGYSVRCSAR